MMSKAQSKTETMTVEYEVADLQNTPDGWQFNYCWVRRGKIEVDDFASTSSITRAVKKDAGLGGRHVKLWDNYDSAAFRLTNTSIGFAWNVVDNP